MRRLDRRAQVIGADHGVALEQVVRLDARAEQAAHQRAQRRTDEFTPRSSTVWLPTGIAGVDEPLAAGARLGRQLLDVVEVRVDEQRVVLARAPRRSSSSMRIGHTTGSRVPIRIVSTCGIARSRPSR